MEYAAQGAPCRRAGRRAVGNVRSKGSMRPLWRSAPCACRAAVLPGFARSPRRSREAVGKLLGFRHTARRRLRRAGLWRSREPGVAGAGYDGAESAADAVSVGNVWWWGVAMAVGSAPARMWTRM